MRTMPCRVACYYKFNVKSWSEEMREGGLGIWNGSIHLPFSVGQQMRSKGKEKKKGASREKLIVKERNHFTADHVAVKPISPFGLVQVAMLGLCLLHSSVKIWKSDHSFRPVALRFCSRRSFSEGKNSIYFWQSFTDALFSVCHLRWKPVCDHGQGFPFLKCLPPLLLCQCVSEENDSWKRPLFRLALSMETGPRLGLGGQQAAFTGLTCFVQVFCNGLDTRRHPGERWPALLPLFP